MWTSFFLATLLSIAPDTVLYNGKILTVDKNFSIVEAVAFFGERIVAVGTSKEVLALAGPETRRVDLHGRTAIPGLIDGHNHLLSGGLNRYSVDLSSVTTIEELLNKLKDAAKQRPGELIRTSSAWHESQLREKRLPTKSDLDRAVPDQPVYVIRGGHEVILNSAAMKQAGITRATTSPEGGEIVRDENGEPNGQFVDNAIGLVRHLLKPFTEEQKYEAIVKMVRELNEWGITGVRETGLAVEDIRLYQKIRDDGKLSMRVSIMPSFDDSLANWGPVSGFGDHWLRLDAVKMVVDGGFEGGLMSEPYVEPKGFYGIQRIETSRLNTIVSMLNKNGWRVGIHCVGDKGLDLVLDAYEAANRERPITGRRWTLEHAFIVRPSQYARIKRLGLVVSIQDHTYAAASSMIKYWGRDRTQQTMPLRRWFDEGIVAGAGTDWPVIPYNPFAGLSFWVTRETRAEGVIGPRMRVSRQEALRAYTINSAYLNFEEDVKGSIEPGKLADLAVLPEDYLTIPEDKIKNIKPVMTWIGGRLIYTSLPN